MNIAVLDVAAGNGGAASVLKYFYEQHRQDKNNHYIYLLSTYHLDETENITVVNVPWVKRGWGSRLYFDFFGVNRYLKQYKIDEVLSLQNTILPGFKGKQTVYEHNALPFAEYRFSLSEDRQMWIYQNVIGKFMLYAIRRADHVIVQTEWMKAAIEERIPGSEDKIEIRFPYVRIPEIYKYQSIGKKIFFYPANSSKFKNHRLIIEACRILENDGYHDYSVIFTLQGNETKNISELHRISQKEKLKIEWIGQLPLETVFWLYERSVLVFPSYIETIGLPIYEASVIGSPILAADCKYARDVLKDYDKVFFFDYRDKDKLAEYMKLLMKADE